MQLVELERKVQELYEKYLAPLAARFKYDLPRSRHDAAGKPTVLMLGNHSSGKSSFINFLVGHPVQKTGLAPVDDGFTIIGYAAQSDEFDGQTVVTHPQLPFRGLERFGPALLPHLRLKSRPFPLLETLTLIDSPGMIDSATEDAGRSYNFTGVVRYFAEQADLIVFFFDPDKPGTTGETMAVFTQALSGLEHKLLIVFNKVDQFVNMRDFARAYGALCWNLSKVVATKDLPHIYNTYLPGLAPPSADACAFPLEDFDISREEVIAEIKRAPARRADNIVSELYEQARALHMHGRVCGAFAQRLLRAKSLHVALVVLALLATGGLLFAYQGSGWTTRIGIALGGAAVAALLWFGGRMAVTQYATTLAKNLDALFERLYHEELTLAERDDLRALWERIKQTVCHSLTAVGLHNVPLFWSANRQLNKLKRAMESEILRLRRDTRGTTQPR